MQENDSTIGTLKAEKGRKEVEVCGGGDWQVKLLSSC